MTSVRKHYFLYVFIHVKNNWERKFGKTACLFRYEGNVHESQDNFFEENTDFNINELNDVLVICIRIAMSQKKMQVNQVEATKIEGRWG